MAFEELDKAQSDFIATWQAGIHNLKKDAGGMFVNIYMKRRLFDILPSAACYHQMKIARYNCFYSTLIILLLGCFSVTAIAQVTNTNKGKRPKKMNPAAEENLGHNIFKAFQTGDDASWVSLYPTNSEYRELTRLMTEAKIIKLPQATIDEMLTKHDNEATAEYERIFHVFLQQADSLGIHWKEAVYGKIDFNSLYPEDFTRKYMNGDIYFTYNKSHFVIEGIEAVEVSGGFKLQSIKSITRIDNRE